MMKVATAGLGAAAACALVLGLTPAAYAADHSMVTNDRVTPAEDPIGSMWFNERGDVVTLCDRDADGAKPILHVALYDPYDPEEYTLTVGGEDNCITRKASSGSAFNLPEATDIGFLICKYPDGYCNAATWHNDH
jgi:hypothetical protein